MILHAVRCDKCFSQVGWNVRVASRVQLIDHLVQKCGWTMGIRDAGIIGVSDSPADLCHDCTKQYRKAKLSALENEKTA